MPEFVMPVGLYEKALPADLSWEARLTTAAKAGYDFMDISVDESDARLARLDWPASDARRCAAPLPTAVFLL